MFGEGVWLGFLATLGAALLLALGLFIGWLSYSPENNIVEVNGKSCIIVESVKIERESGRQHVAYHYCKEE